MLHSLRRTLDVYGAIAAMVPKETLAYNLWAWAWFLSQLLSMVIYVFFWRAVYASSTGETIAGLALQQTLNYVLLARIFAPLLENRLISRFGHFIRTGQLAIELLRPTDFQVRELVIALAHSAVAVLRSSPLFVVAWAFFGLRLSTDPLAWLLFFITLGLGQAIVFFFDWVFASLAFYSTETWGLSVVRVGVAQFFSGALVPLAMMPGWLQAAVAAMPFAQAIAVPLGFLSGVTSPAHAPQILLTQLLWLAGLVLVSRLFFNLAVRKVTVQGG